MSEFSDSIFALRDRCLRCWAEEFGDIHPRSKYMDIAKKEMDRHGNPPHSKQCLKEES